MVSDATWMSHRRRMSEKFGNLEDYVLFTEVGYLPIVYKKKSYMLLEMYALIMYRKRLDKEKECYYLIIVIMYRMSPTTFPKL